MKFFTTIDMFNSDVNVQDGSLVKISSSKGFRINLEEMRDENKNDSRFDEFEFSPFGPHSEYIQKQGDMRIKLVIKKANYGNYFIVLLVIEDKKGKVKGKLYLTRNSKWKLKTEDMDLSFIEDAVKIPIPIIFDNDLEKLLEKLKEQKGQKKELVKEK